MEKTVKLRGHHLLCMLGYRGMGYSPAYAQNMSAVHGLLCREPETKVELVAGVDDLCVCFPTDQPSHCDSSSVHGRDAHVLKHLGAAVGEALPWSEVLRRVANRVKPEDIPDWCAACPWLAYGVCEEGVRNVQDGGGLRPLEGA